MNSKITNAMIFILGVATGSAVTWQYIKKKYEQLTQEEINSVKETFSSASQLKEYVNPQYGIASSKAEKPDISTYLNKIQENGYTDYSNINSVKKNETPISHVKSPYTISPDEFGENEDYDTISLMYYADKILADEDDEIVQDIADKIGYESLTTFGEYEDDAVFVRNDTLKCDYEILLDQRTYSDVTDRKPHDLIN